MRTDTEAKRVTIYVGETDHVGGKRLYQVIVAKLHSEGIAGATVTRGILGYGESSRMHAAHLLDLSEDLPVAIVFVDTPDKVESVLPKLGELIESGIVVTDSVRLLRYSK